MTPRERAALRAWCRTHDGAVAAYVFVLGMSLVVGAMVGDLLDSSLAFGIIVGLGATWPVIVLGLNGLVLLVRYRTDRRLRLERKVKALEERERRIAALEGDTGV